MNNKALKVLFAGTADFSATFLEPILNSQHQVIGVVTQPDKVSGRGKKVQMTKVKELAVAHNIPVYQFTSSLRHPENYQELLKLDFDIMVVVAFGDILPLELIDYPKYKSINVHPSLLPFGRGASPVQNTIAQGDNTTAFCIIKMDETLDTGDILYREEVQVDAKETSLTLFNKLSAMGGPILNKVLDNIEYYLAQAKPQDPLNVPEPKKTYTRKIKKEYGRFNPELEAIVLERKLRAYTPWPGLFFTHPEQPEQDIKIIEAQALDFTSFNNLVQSNPKLEFLDYKALQDLTTDEIGKIIASTDKAIYVLCADNSLLEISSIQLPGKKPMDIKSLKNGYPKLLTLGVNLK
ncbi:methionyl-tRNA formyltransferase [Psittacicella gerlachiana]|uniref:Methionyl-tRNA formyltransferase n=1 Tax=Psittacicella gerlachiana TaxID=2028574 RepID=A0A3A1YHW0_9GAMM|nr:methionyl-tRNA formyltransferase [Psittacicella gerlachiana]RIY37843.1 methionyl-tRNA formyltransferase [Psittacicella gerlachiana]